MTDSVPVIDINELDGPAARTAIHSACADWGFFQVTGHGIDSFVIDEIFAASHAFFAQPAADKRRILRDADNRGILRPRADEEPAGFEGDLRLRPGDGGRLRPRWPEGPCVRASRPPCALLRELHDAGAASAGGDRVEPRVGRRFWRAASATHTRASCA